MKVCYLFILSLILATSVACSNSSDDGDQPVVEQKPNIIFIILDD